MASTEESLAVMTIRRKLSNVPRNNSEEKGHIRQAGGNDVTWGDGRELL